MIGVLGGSFDPIHFGHINPLYELSDIFEFDQIRLVPTYNSAVNKTFNASANHRFNMVSLISSSETNNFVADNAEIVKQNTRSDELTFNTRENLTRLAEFNKTQYSRRCVRPNEVKTR